MFFNCIIYQREFNKLGCNQYSGMSFHIQRTSDMKNINSIQFIYCIIFDSYFKIKKKKFGVMVHTYYPCTWDAKEDLKLRPAWTTKWVPYQPGLCSNTLSQKPKSYRCGPVAECLPSMHKIWV
jgi:hypothetical protein